MSGVSGQVAIVVVRSMAFADRAAKDALSIGFYGTSYFH